MTDLNRTSGGGTTVRVTQGERVAVVRIARAVVDAPPGPPGPPGPQGEAGIGLGDPGDLTLLFDNLLI